MNCQNWVDWFFWIEFWKKCWCRLVFIRYVCPLGFLIVYQQCHCVLVREYWSKTVVWEYTTIFTWLLFITSYKREFNMYNALLKTWFLNGWFLKKINIEGGERNNYPHFCEQCLYLSFDIIVLICNFMNI